MAIDPETLARQRLSIVGDGERHETKCERCGGRTTSETGVCSRCSRASVPDLSRLTVPQLSGLIESARGELKRRMDEAREALER